MFPNLRLQRHLTPSFLSLSFYLNLFPSPTISLSLSDLPPLSLSPYLCLSLSYYCRNQLSDIPARTQVMTFVHRGIARSKKTEHLFDGEPSVRFSVPGCISLRLDPSHSSDMCWGKLPHSFYRNQRCPSN